MWVWVYRSLLLFPRRACMALSLARYVSSVLVLSSIGCRNLSIVYAIALVLTYLVSNCDDGITVTSCLQPPVVLYVSSYAAQSAAVDRIDDKQ